MRNFVLRVLSVYSFTRISLINIHRKIGHWKDHFCGRDYVRMKTFPKIKRFIDSVLYPAVMYLE